MGKLKSWLFGLGLGAGLMYFLDPDLGNQRKARVRDHVTRMLNMGDEGVMTATRDFRNRVSGVLSNAVAMISDEDLPDQVMESRIRSRMGTLARHTGDVMVSVENGRVTLNGNMLQDEVEDFLSGLRKMRGVHDVQNNLRLHREAGDNLYLQGEGMLERASQGQMSPSTRLLAGIGAGYMMVYGMARGGLIGFFAKVGGLILGSRAFSNMDISSLAGAPATGEAINVRKTLNVNAPVEEVYGLWANFENFPRFMSNIEEIRDLGDGRSHWVVKGPVGSKVEFDALITENVPNQVVAWKTAPDAQVKHSGQVRFKESQKGTQVNVNMDYTPPAGAAGHAVAKMFGKDPKSEMDADLARFKSLLEEGKTTAKNKRVTRDQVMPVTGESSDVNPDEYIDWTDEERGRNPKDQMGDDPLTTNNL